MYSATYYKYILSMLIQEVTFLFCIQEVPGSNVGWDTMFWPTFVWASVRIGPLSCHDALHPFLYKYVKKILFCTVTKHN